MGLQLNSPAQKRPRYLPRFIRRARAEVHRVAPTSPQYIFLRPSLTAAQDLRSLMLFRTGECSPKGAPDLTSLMN